MFPSLQQQQSKQLLIYTSDQQVATSPVQLSEHTSTPLASFRQTMYSRKLDKPASEYPSTKIFDMASTLKIITKEQFGDDQLKNSNKKIKISINSSSVMRVKDSDKLRGLLQKIEKSRAFKM